VARAGGHPRTGAGRGGSASSHPARAAAGSSNEDGTSPARARTPVPRQRFGQMERAGRAQEPWKNEKPLNREKAEKPSRKQVKVPKRPSATD
jgi:hypothetical protein